MTLYCVAALLSLWNCNLIFLEITCVLQTLLFVSNYHLFFFLPDFFHICLWVVHEMKRSYFEYFYTLTLFIIPALMLLYLTSEPTCVHYLSLEINLDRSLICPNAAGFTQTLLAIGHESSSGRLNICKGVRPWRFIQILERSVMSPSVRNPCSCWDFKHNCVQL